MTRAFQHLSRRAVIAGAIALVPAGAHPAASQTAADAVFERLKVRGGLVLMRHADAPGGPGQSSAGDPPGFRLDDCTTQRNLSEEGRADARRTGVRLEAAGVRFDRVLSSAWCRCTGTARLVTGADPVIEPALNNFFDAPARRPTQIAALRERLAAMPPGERVLLVTHGVVISALVGVSAASGEMVVIEPDGRGGYRATARIGPD